MNIMKKKEVKENKKVKEKKKTAKGKSTAVPQQPSQSTTKEVNGKIIVQGKAVLSMEKIDTLPKKDFILGSREIEKKIKEGKVNKVIVASNCPEKIIRRFKKVEIKMFTGDEKELGTKVGKPFPVAAIAYQGEKK